ncbi:hypothetical protein G6F56_012150 [Rhizopus delemar]|nr:hypothetical protein G6F56_012150 [Rhizopus delemar]
MAKTPSKTTCRSVEKLLYRIKQHKRTCKIQNQRPTPLSIIPELSAPKISDIRSTITTSENSDISNITTSVSITEATQDDSNRSEQTHQVTGSIDTAEPLVLNSPSKRLFSERTPPMFPADFRPRPTPIEPHSEMTIDSQNLPDLNLESVLTFDFGEMSSPATTTENEENNFFSGPTFAWISRFEQRLRQYDQRLSQMEHLIEENSRLRANLDTANRKIEELEKKATIPQSPKPSQGTEASKHAALNTAPKPSQELPKTSPGSFASAALKGKSAPTPPKTPKTKEKEELHLVNTRQSHELLQ